MATCGGLLLFTVAFLILTPRPAPRFGFLKAAELRYVSVHDVGGRSVCGTSYFLQGSHESIVQRANRELAGWKIVRDKMLDTIEYTKGEEHVWVVGWNFGTPAEPQTHLLYDRPSVPSDVPRSWVDRVRSWFPWLG